MKCRLRTQASGAEKPLFREGKQSACPTLSVGAFQWAKPKPLFLQTGGIE